MCRSQCNGINNLSKNPTKVPFTLAEGYSQKDFMKCIQTILKDNKINSLMTLWGCISDKQPQLWMISSAQMEMLSQGYAIFPPHGTQVYARQLMDSYFQKNISYIMKIY